MQLGTKHKVRSKITQPVVMETFTVYHMGVRQISYMCSFKSVHTYKPHLSMTILCLRFKKKNYCALCTNHASKMYNKYLFKCGGKQQKKYNYYLYIVEL